MIIPDQKKAMMTIMAKRSPNGEVDSAPMQPETSKDEEGEIDGRHAAAQDMLAAMHEKSAQKLMEAMANFHDLHMAERDKPDVFED